MRLAFVLALALTAPIFAGCLEMVDEPADSTSPVKRSATPRTIAPRASGTMTGDASEEPATAALCGSVMVPLDQTYCATKTIRLEGTMDQMTELPVTLDTFVGAIDVSSAAGNAWSVIVTLQARGDSEQDAIANLDNIQFTWSHEGKEGHALRAAAEKKDPNINNGEEAGFQATLPADVKYFLLCDTAAGSIHVNKLLGSQILLDSASGDLSASDIQADWFFAETASGDIDVSKTKADEIHADSASGHINIQGEADQVTADTASGGATIDVVGAVLSVDSASGSIQVRFTPTADGSIYLQTASGSVDLTLPESAQNGYSIDASTSSGSVEILLKDGKVSGEDEEKHFLTNNYSGRAVKTAVDARSTSGSVQVQPASG
jgi:hypothetical protein